MEIISTAPLAWVAILICLMPWATLSLAPPQQNLISTPRKPLTDGLKYSDNFYNWKSNYRVHYVEAGTSGPPVLLVPGFGVGTFHYNYQIDELSKNHRVFSFDLLGQGQSWPEDGIVKDEDQLCYSADLWREQIIYFIENICEEPVHIVGNSLGGYLSLATAATRPDLIKSVLLLNAAPFWSFLPADKKPSIAPWDGVLPAPDWLLKFGSSYFNLMKSKTNVQTMLKTVYASQDAFGEELVSDIIESASRPGGPEAFTSILFSPKLNETFDSMLGKVSKPVCLAYGREDPWIVPYWGQRAKRINPSIVYFEMSPSGHCPHHESPNAANKVISNWVDEVEELYKSGGSDGASLPASPDDRESSRAMPAATRLASRLRDKVEGVYSEPSGADVTVTLVDGSPRNIFERVGALL